MAANDVNNWRMAVARDLIVVTTLMVLALSITCSTAMSGLKQSAFIQSNSDNLRKLAVSASKVNISGKVPSSKDYLTVSQVFLVLMCLSTPLLLLCVWKHNRLGLLIWSSVVYWLLMALLCVVAIQTNEVPLVGKWTQEVYGYGRQFFCNSNKSLQLFVEFVERSQKCCRQDSTLKCVTKSQIDCLQAIRQNLGSNPSKGLAYATMVFVLLDISLCIWLAQMLEKPKRNRRRHGG